MSLSPLVQTLVERLEAAGYVRLSTPFRVASVEFQFTAALRGVGARALDLVIVVDAVTGEHGDTNGLAVRNRIETLSRALDVTQSRYTLSAVLVGAVLTDDVKALAETCRVLQVPALALDADGALEHKDAEILEDQIRLLLPLRLPEVAEDSEIIKTGALDLLLTRLPADVDAALLREIITDSTRGESGVKAALGRRIDDVLGPLEAEQ
ncbi:hypothetical protein [Xanthobacter oligotrophicus]|uniref:hypothetical protein n=1 Tax=Xanthobacter oligotrophicus TaxID=2607286 RepID=UPI0011F269C1|nr:hypothetical protein [Xanthobacter oligotrophicus]MCG5235309.1 hypothetical protein [Xanthobacter oligotrophicus]